MKLLALLSLLLAGCAHTPNPSLEEKVKSEANLANAKDLSAEVTGEIDADESLSPEQKQQLKAFHASHSGQMTRRAGEGSP